MRGTTTVCEHHLLLLDSDKHPSQLQHLRWDGLHVSKDSRGALGMDLCRPVQNTIASLVLWRRPELLQNVTHSHQCCSSESRPQVLLPHTSLPLAVEPAEMMRTIPKETSRREPARCVTTVKQRLPCTAPLKPPQTNACQGVGLSQYIVSLYSLLERF